MFPFSHSRGGGAAAGGAQTIWSSTDKGSGIVVSNSNKTARSATEAQGVRGINGYGVADTKSFQVRADETNGNLFIGIANLSSDIANQNPIFYPGVWAVGSSGSNTNNGSLTSAGGGYSAGTIINVTIANGTVSFSKNGVSFLSMTFTGTVFPFLSSGNGSSPCSGTLQAPDANNNWG